MNEVAEEEIKEAMDIVKVFRSSQSALNIPNKQPPAFIISLTKTFSEQAISIVKTLAKVGSLSFSKEAPKGCLVSLVNLEVSIALDVKDMVDLNAHKAKLQKQFNLVKNSCDSILKKTQMANYEEKTPLEIREKNTDSIKQKQTEMAEIEKEIANVEAAMK